MIVHSVQYSYMKPMTLPATEARNRFFEIIDLVRHKGEEIIIEKDGKPAVKVSPLPAAKSPEEIKEILLRFRRVFARSARRKYWSILDSPAWRKKEAKYIEDLSKGKLR